MRVVKRKVNKDNVKLGLILVFMFCVLVFVLLNGDLS